MYIETSDPRFNGILFKYFLAFLCVEIALSLYGTVSLYGMEKDKTEQSKEHIQEYDREKKERELKRVCRSIVEHAALLSSSKRNSKDLWCRESIDFDTIAKMGELTQSQFYEHYTPEREPFPGYGSFLENEEKDK